MITTSVWYSSESDLGSGPPACEPPPYDQRAPNHIYVSMIDWTVPGPAFSTVIVFPEHENIWKGVEDERSHWKSCNDVEGRQ
jgi:hypothetical protein